MKILGLDSSGIVASVAVVEDVYKRQVYRSLHRACGSETIQGKHSEGDPFSEWGFSGYYRRTYGQDDDSFRGNAF